MNRIITAVIVAVAWIFSATAGAQTLSKYYVNAFGLEADGSQGGYAFGFGWDDPAKLRIDQSGDSITFYPNISLCNEDDYWCNPASALGGTHYVEASAFAEVAVSVGDAAQDFEFKGCFTGGTLTKYHTLVAFMQVLNPDAGYTVYEGTQQFDSSGCWNFTHSEDGSANAIVQYGLKMMGQNVHPDKAAEMGSYGAVLNRDPAPAAPKDAELIPTLPVGALFGLLTIVGWFGARKVRNRA
jgi:hypothetical protein